jgi:DNA-binding MarR family transcriptional regulator
MLDRASRLLFAINDIGRAGTQAIEEQVGVMHSSNAVIGTLGALADDGAHRPRDVEKFIGATSATVSRILDQLEEQGDVERLPGASLDDRRATMLQLTVKGRRAESDVATAWVAAGGQMRVSLGVAIDVLAEIAAVPTPRERAVDPASTCLALGRLGVTLVESLTSTLDQIETNGALVLCLLQQHDGSVRPITVSKLLGLSSGATSKLLDRLETAGFVERTYGTMAGDRRGVEIALTAVGRGRLALISAQFVDQAIEMLDAFQSLADLLDAPAR